MYLTDSLLNSNCAFQEHCYLLMQIFFFFFKEDSRPGVNRLFIVCHHSGVAKRPTQMCSSLPSSHQDEMLLLETTFSLLFFKLCFQGVRRTSAQQRCLSAARSPDQCAAAWLALPPHPRVSGDTWARVQRELILFFLSCFQTSFVTAQVITAGVQHCGAFASFRVSVFGAQWQEQA